MVKQVVFISFLLSTLSSSLFASDSTKYRLAITAGLTNNTVYGTMVSRNNEFGTNVKMKNKIGFNAAVNVDKSLNSPLFIATGLTLMYKQVNPMLNTFAIYRDELKTAYLSIPIEIGVNVVPVDEFVNLSLTAGAMTNFRVIDKSNIGPDRADFKTPFVSESVSAGARVSINTSSKVKFVIRYNYLYDLSNAYVESLYFYGGGRITKFYYKYKTSFFSIGFQFPLKK